MDKRFCDIFANCHLSDAMTRQLRDVGYVVIEDAIADSKCDKLSRAYDEAVLNAHPNDVSVSGSIRVRDFVSRGSDFDELYLYPPLLAACSLVIGRRFKLSTLLSRTIPPGASQQSLHVDFARDVDGWPMIGFIIMVDEFRIDNGATRFIPGSHLNFDPQGDAIEETDTVDENQVLACGPAGSMIIYNGSIRHGYAVNKSDNPRRSIQGAYILYDAKSATDQAARILPETFNRISDLAKYLLDVEAKLSIAV